MPSNLKDVNINLIGSGGWIRTNDLRVMSPTSYQAAPPRINVDGILSKGSD